MTSTESAIAEKKQIPIVCPGHTRPLAELQFCRADNRLVLVSACHDSLPMIRDGVTGDWIGTWKGHKGAVWSCRLDQTASLAATASGDFSVCVWDAISGAKMWTFPHNHIVKTCDFSPNSQYLATGGHEGVLRIYDLKQQEELWVMSSNAGDKVAENAPTVKPIQIPVGESKSKIIVGKVNWWNDNVLLAGCADGAIRFWNVANAFDQSVPTLLPFQTLRVSQEGCEIRDMEITTTSSDAVDQQPQVILTVAAGASVYFYEMSPLDQNKPPTLLHAHTMRDIHFRDEGGASLHPSGGKFIAGGSDLWVRVFEFASGLQLECLKGHHGPIRCLRYSPDGTHYATGSEDGTIRLWQV